MFENSDDSYDGLPPDDCKDPGPMDHDVEFAIGFLHHVEAETATAFNTLAAIDTLITLTARIDGPRVSRTNCDRLIYALGSAHNEIVGLFHDPDQRQKAAQSIEAIENLISATSAAEASQVFDPRRIVSLTVCIQSLRKSVRELVRATEQSGTILDKVINSFRRALAEPATVEWTIFGLDMLLRDGRPTADVAHSPEQAGETAKLLAELAPKVSEIVEPAISADQVHLGMGAAASLLLWPNDPLEIDRALHAGLLLADLRGFICRAAIRRRGDPLERNMRLRAALAAKRPLSIPLQ